MRCSLAMGVLGSFVSLAGVAHEKRIYERQEIIDGATLRYQSTIEDGRLTEQYFVGEQAVDRVVYEQRLQEVHEDYARFVVQQLASAPVNESVKKRIALKLLTRLREVLKQQLVLLMAEHVKPFLAFKSETIDAQQSLDRITQRLLPALDFVQEPGVEQESAEKLCALSDHVQQVYDRLIALYHDTLEVVLSRDDDPKTLRKLLEGMNS